MILEMDVGNSRLKWRVIDDAGTRLDGGANPHGMSDPFAGIPRVAVSRVRVSNVTGSETAERIREWCGRFAGVVPEFAKSVAEFAGVKNGYVEPQRLGVDRWLAVLAAWHRNPAACCVVDCGSALTIDFVDCRGQHGGGLIAPGLTMMRRSLLSDTKEIRLVAEEQEWSADRLGGHSTEEAVLGGIIGMAAGLIERAVRQFEADQGDGITVVLTGGEAVMLKAHLGVKCEIDPDLVLDGLAVALP